MRHFSTLLFAFIFMASVAFAWDNVRVQTSDGMEVNATNPLPVTFGTGSQTIGGDLSVGGNVGVGTTSATSALSVVGDISATGEVYGATLQAGGTTGVSEIRLDANNTVIQSQGDRGIYLGDLNAANTTSLYVDGWICADNNIGIGTTAPVFPLQIVKQASSGSTLFAVVNQEPSGSTAGATMALYTNDLASVSFRDRIARILFGGTYDTTSTYSAGAAIYAFATRDWTSGNNSQALIAFYTRGTDTAISEKMTIQADGAVYVGASGTINFVEGAGDIYIKDELEVDGSMYLGNALTDRLTIDSGVYQSNAFSHFKIGSTCYEVTFVPSYKVATCTCASIGM